MIRRMFKPISKTGLILNNQKSPGRSRVLEEMYSPQKSIAHQSLHLSIRKFTIQKKLNKEGMKSRAKCIDNMTGLASQDDSGDKAKKKRPAAKAASADSGEETKKKKPAAKAAKTKDPVWVDYSKIDLTCTAESPLGKPWNYKIASWNVNGVRAWLEKGGMAFIENENPDIMCLQETKCSDDKLPDDIRDLSGYSCYWLAADTAGYSGVGLLSKTKPNSVAYGIGSEKHDSEGRVITAEYSSFYVVTAYIPNSARGLTRLPYRMEWDEDFRKYLLELEKKKPVILCGDLNVAHNDIDLANPKTNKKTAGFTKEERDSFGTLLSESGFLDSFRHLHPDQTGAYTFWTYLMNARAKNVGWRLDYFLISKSLKDQLCENAIRSSVMGSDHCPITLFMALPEKT